jgi:hypothetical protein
MMIERQQQQQAAHVLAVTTEAREETTPMSTSEKYPNQEVQCQLMWDMESWQNEDEESQLLVEHAIVEEQLSGPQTPATPCPGLSNDPIDRCETVHSSVFKTNSFIARTAPDDCQQYGCNRQMWYGISCNIEGRYPMAAADSRVGKRREACWQCNKAFIATCYSETAQIR